MNIRFILATIVAALIPASAHAQSSVELFTPETVTIAEDVRIVGVDGERSWIGGDYGKTRFGPGDGTRGFRLLPRAVEGDLIWQPRFSWALSGTAVVTAQDGQENAIDLSEAFLTYKPLLSGSTKVIARAGLFWPPVSLEHSGPEWRPRDTITPSAINSWIGDEVKVGGVEVQFIRSFSTQRVALTVGLFGFNDTAGTLLAFRGWALHDQKATGFGLQPLPPLDAFMQSAQAPRTRPVIELDNRPGWYAKLDWAPVAWLDLQAFHYDNRGDPAAVTPSLQWGWHTRFNNLAVALTFGSWQVKGQALAGNTLMGFPMPDRLWVDTDFRSAYGMVIRKFANGSVSARIEAFGTTSRGSVLTSAWSENGSAVTIAARRELTRNVTVLAEGLHIESVKAARTQIGLDRNQAQNLFQLAFRLHL
ncbi:MAG: hypothetical protein JWM65_10 [Sphingomonas bacterium]|nr:hypothetical protein [Sphingomonas bacterium]